MADAAEAVEPNVVQEAFPGFEGRAVRGASISLSGTIRVDDSVQVVGNDGAADALREQLHDLAEATDHVIHLEERIAYLRGVLGA